MENFSSLVNDVINKDELSKVFGGTGGDPSQDRACDKKACSKEMELVKRFCTNGDGICRYNVA